MLARVALALAFVAPIYSFVSSPASETTVDNFFSKYAFCLAQNSVPCLFQTGVFSEDIQIIVREFPPKSITHQYAGIQGIFDFFCKFFSDFSNALDPAIQPLELQLLRHTNQVFYVYSYPPGNITEESITWTLGPHGASSVLISYLGGGIKGPEDPTYWCRDPSKMPGLEYWNEYGTLPPP